MWRDSDACGYDRWRDDLAVPDPYETYFEPVYSHGLIVPAEMGSAGTPVSDAIPQPLADGEVTADARSAPITSPPGGRAGSRTGLEKRNARGVNAGAA